MGDIDKIVRLLDDTDVERRIAAARVLGALKTKNADATMALVAMMAKEDSQERRAAAIALGDTKAAKGLPSLVDALLDPASAVRAAAQASVRQFGDRAVKPLQQKLDVTTADSERSLLSTALASLGGQSATKALLDGLAGAGEDAARQAALRFRQEIKGAPKDERKEHRLVIESYLLGGAVRGKSQTKKASSKLAPPMAPQDKVANQHARAAAAKMLGFVEDRAALGALLHLVADTTEPDVVRQEAVVGIRFALGTDRKAPDAQATLIALLGDAPPSLARAAMDTLQNLILDDTATKGLAALAKDASRDVAQFSILALASLQTKASTKALASLVHHGQPIERAQAAATALGGQRAAVPFVLDILSDDDLLGGSARVTLCADIVATMAAEVTPAQRQKLVSQTIASIEVGRPGYEALVKVAREVDGDGLADAMRALVTSLRRKKKTEKAAAVLGLLERGEGATVEDRFRRAVLELGQSRKDTRPQARNRDPALKLFADLLDEGGDLLRLLAKEKSVDDEARFYLGWHFIETGHSVGEELLDDIIARRPRTKLAKMAKNKKKLELDDD